MFVYNIKLGENNNNSFNLIHSLFSFQCDKLILIYICIQSIFIVKFLVKYFAFKEFLKMTFVNKFKYVFAYLSKYKISLFFIPTVFYAIFSNFIYREWFQALWDIIYWLFFNFPPRGGQGGCKISLNGVINEVNNYSCIHLRNRYNFSSIVYEDLTVQVRSSNLALIINQDMQPELIQRRAAIFREFVENPNYRINVDRQESIYNINFLHTTTIVSAGIGIVMTGFFMNLIHGVRIVDFLF